PMTNFGPGEYPYTTILREETDESIAFDLKEYGYGTHAIHNHTGKFYGRYLVYPHLGFDSYTSVEYMQDVERNPLNWADDSILTGEILKSMDSTEEPDFVYAVSVQGHGKYPLEVIDETQTITVTGFNPEEAVGFEYFTNQIYRMDAFLGELIAALGEKGEPTVLCIYGDHLPKFAFEASDLENGSLYETEYVIWDNIGLKERDRDLSAYELYPYLMKQIDKHAGIITQFHQYCADDPDFFADLHTLQYDMLYGRDYAFGGTDKYEKTEMKMGIDPINITDIRKVGKFIYVEGENFTKASKIFINGEEVKTTLYNSGRIMCRKGNSLDPGDKIEVVQMSSKKTHLSTTAEWTWYPTGSMVSALDTANQALENVESQEDIAADIAEEEGFGTAEHKEAA
ncbi:MAG: LTA synthase family protein, partial [Firmicutes bacterium]|nr:LTA synthase family protein [Bacillota bacterium]